ncbi:MAG: diacylglycerol kinase [Alphaproteobacteria bacterium]|nr:diacylglycerol kinase [Alphaproteobacteria bacterium]
MHPTEQAKGIMRILKAFGYAISGLKAACASESAFRIELVVCAIFIPIAFLLPVYGVERAALIGSLLLVLIVELLNSAVESTIDRISEEQNPLSGKAKDLSSAAVLVSIVNAAIVWAVILVG